MKKIYTLLDSGIRRGLSITMLLFFATTVFVLAQSIDLKHDGTLGVQDGFLGPDISICRNDTVTIEAPLAFSYLWDTGHTTRFIRVVPQQTTDYSVRITTAQGIEQRDTIRVVVRNVPQVIVSPVSTNLLPGEAVLLTANGAQSYVWSNGVVGHQNFVRPHLPTNQYTVVGTAANGCKASASATVQVQYTTKPSFEYTKGCLGDTTYFQAKIQTNDTILSVQWDLDGNLLFNNGSGFQQKFLYNSAGERLVGIRVVTKHSVSAHIQYLPVVIGDKPKVDFGFSGSCAQTPVQFTDKSSVQAGTIVSRKWYFGTNIQSEERNPLITLPQAGQYTIKLKVTSSLGCVDSLSRSYNAAAPPPLQVAKLDGTAFDTSKPYLLYLNDTLKLLATGIFDSVVWNNQIGTNRIKNVRYNVVRSGSYNVYAYRLGCFSYMAFSVQQSDQLFDPTVKIQNILTPNGDGINDSWDISALNSLKPLKVTIFSRSGVPVFESLSYQHNWQGTFNNSVPLPEGSYFYLIEGAKGKVFKGTITLLR